MPARKGLVLARSYGSAAARFAAGADATIDFARPFVAKVLLWKAESNGFSRRAAAIEVLPRPANWIVHGYENTQGRARQ
jgi:hypothetical protein